MRYLNTIPSIALGQPSLSDASLGLVSYRESFFYLANSTKNCNVMQENLELLYLLCIFIVALDNTTPDNNRMNFSPAV